MACNSRLASGFVFLPSLSSLSGSPSTRLMRPKRNQSSAGFPAGAYCQSTYLPTSTALVSCLRWTSRRSQAASSALSRATTPRFSSSEMRVPSRRIASWTSPTARASTPSRDVAGECHLFSALAGRYPAAATRCGLRCGVSHLTSYAAFSSYVVRRRPMASAAGDPAGAPSSSSRFG